MTTRDELHTMRDRLEALANRHPSETSLSAAQLLANAAECVNDALMYAVDANEKKRAKGQRPSPAKQSVAR